MDRWHRNDTIPLYFYMYDQLTGQPVACDAAPTITITDPAGTAQVSAANMSSGSNTGEYYYIYTAPAAGVRGVWNYLCSGTSGSYTSAPLGAFEVR